MARSTDNFIQDLARAEATNDLELAVDLVLRDWVAWGTYNEPLEWESLKTLKKVFDNQD